MDRASDDDEDDDEEEGDDEFDLEDEEAGVTLDDFEMTAQECVGFRRFRYSRDLRLTLCSVSAEPR